MKTDYANDYARCQVRTSSFLPAGALELSQLATDAAHRMQGYATELMVQVCHDADIEGIVLVLLPADGALQSFYRRFGFSEIQPRPALMARMPQLFKVKMNPISSAAVSSIHGR